MQERIYAVGSSSKRGDVIIGGARMLPAQVGHDVGGVASVDVENGYKDVEVAVAKRGSVVKVERDIGRRMGGAWMVCVSDRRGIVDRAVGVISWGIKGMVVVWTVARCIIRGGRLITKLLRGVTAM